MVPRIALHLVVLWLALVLVLMLVPTDAQRISKWRKDKAPARPAPEGASLPCAQPLLLLTVVLTRLCPSTRLDSARLGSWSGAQPQTLPRALRTRPKPGAAATVCALPPTRHCRRAGPSTPLQPQVRAAAAKATATPVAGSSCRCLRWSGIMALQMEAARYVCVNLTSPASHRTSGFTVENQPNRVLLWLVLC
jgi:hypothetical protein